MIRIVILVCLVLAGGARAAAAGEMTIAVAANFALAAERLRAAFNVDEAHTIALVSASTGKLASQASLGAPFDVLLAADQARPQRLIADGHAVAGSQFTYALGQLVLWGANVEKLKGRQAAKVLSANDFKRLAIANPDLAPYGTAAWQAISSLSLEGAIKPKLVYGENILQAYAFAASGNADMALIARSFMLSARIPDRGAYLDVPGDLHAPIRQDAVLLMRGKDNDVAIAFLEFLKGDQARQIIDGLGYRAGGGQ